MAELLEETEVRIEWADIQKQRPHPRPKYQERSKGVHLTDVLRYLHFGSMKEDLEQKTAEWDLGPEVMPLKMCLGMAWEEWAAGLYPEMEWQPGEFSQDGIAISPDGFSVTSTILGYPHVVVEEFKLTWKSCRIREVLKENLWMWQVKGYCSTVGVGITDHLAFARLHVCWINGDYSRPYTPRYRRYLIRFDEDELKRNWDMVVRNKERAVEWNLKNPRM